MSSKVASSRPHVCERTAYLSHSGSVKNSSLSVLVLMSHIFDVDEVCSSEIENPPHPVEFGEFQTYLYPKLRLVAGCVNCCLLVDYVGSATCERVEQEETIKMNRN